MKVEINIYVFVTWIAYSRMVAALCSWPVPRRPQCLIVLFQDGRCARPSPASMSDCLVPGWSLHFVLGPSLAGLNVWLCCSRMVAALCSWPVPRRPRCLIVLFQDGRCTLFWARPSPASMSDCLVPGWSLHFVLGPSLAGLNVWLSCSRMVAALCSGPVPRRPQCLIVLFQDGRCTLFWARPSPASMSVYSSTTQSTPNRGLTDTPIMRYNGRTTASRRWMCTITTQRCR